jgi:hypothetical protein
MAARRSSQVDRDGFGYCTSSAQLRCLDNAGLLGRRSPSGPRAICRIDRPHNLRATIEELLLTEGPHSLFPPRQLQIPVRRS